MSSGDENPNGGPGGGNPIIASSALPRAVAAAPSAPVDSALPPQAPEEEDTIPVAESIGVAQVVDAQVVHERHPQANKLDVGPKGDETLLQADQKLTKVVKLVLEEEALSDASIRLVQHALDEMRAIGGDIDGRGPTGKKLDPKEYEPLFIALRAGPKGIPLVKYLVEEGADINRRSTCAYAEKALDRPVILALSKSIAAFDFLVSKGARLDFGDEREKNGETEERSFLALVVYNTTTHDIAKRLFERENALHGLNYLLQLKQLSVEELTKGLVIASHGRTVDAMSMLIEAGADAHREVPLFSVYGFAQFQGTPLRMALTFCMYNSHTSPSDAIELLIKKCGVEVPKDAVSEYLINTSQCSKPCEINIVKLLLDRGADPNWLDPFVDRDDYRTGRDRTVLMYAQTEQIARLLVDYGADITQTGRNKYVNWTLLHAYIPDYRVEGEDLKKIRWLLEQPRISEIINVVDTINGNMTPLEKAKYKLKHARDWQIKKQKEIIKMLRAKGAEDKKHAFSACCREDPCGDLEGVFAPCICGVLIIGYAIGGLVCCPCVTYYCFTTELKWQ